MHQFKGDIDARNLTIIKINKKQKQTTTTHIQEFRFVTIN